MDWLVKMFGGTDMALVGIGLAGLIFVTLVMFYVLVTFSQSVRKEQKKAEERMFKLMSLYLKDYEERHLKTESAPESEAPPVKVGVSQSGAKQNKGAAALAKYRADQKLKKAQEAAAPTPAEAE